MSATPAVAGPPSGGTRTSKPRKRVPANPADRAILRTARWLAVAAFISYVLSGGGRIVGSDEVTMLEVSRALLSGRVEVPAGATAERGDGAHVSKNAAGQAVAALPLVAVAQGAARLSGLDPPKRALLVRFIASFFNAIVTAVVLAVFYVAVRRMGASRAAGLAAAVMLGFATPLWVYSKSFMAEPLQALGLLLALTGASRAASSAPPAPWAERLAALGAFIAISAKLSMLPLAAASLTPLLAADPRRWRVPALGVAAALAGHALYNVARFGTALETGYGAQATPAAYSTPILVGLYGLLLSSGKGVMWFAPPLWLAASGFRAMRASAPAVPRRWAERLGLTSLRGSSAWGIAVAWAVGLVLYGTFQHWAGDGSFGPRYLLPLVPLGFIPVAFALTPRPGFSLTRVRRVLVLTLALAGFAVQAGGVSIYFGAQMREAGDYPYRLPLEHPRFMSDSHFNPAFSPIVAHWRMGVRNALQHLRGEAPSLRAAGSDSRLGIDRSDQEAMLRALDYWWLYLGYAGYPRAPVWALVALLKVLGLAAIVMTWRAWRREAT